ELQGGEMVPVHLLTNEDTQTERGDQSSVATGEYSTSIGCNYPQNIQAHVERPNIFVLYEQNIGLLSPLIADELKDAADQYPAEWIEAAFREAVQHNKRKWSYIRAILRRWETEGRQQWNA